VLIHVERNSQSICFQCTALDHENGIGPSRHHYYPHTHGARVNATEPRTGRMPEELQPLHHSLVLAFQSGALLQICRLRHDSFRRAVVCLQRFATLCPLDAPRLQAGQTSLPWTRRECTWAIRTVRVTRTIWRARSNTHLLTSVPRCDAQS
jgi:hypothetical protein